MPRKPKRPCSYPGCPNLTDGQYCKEHEAVARRQYNKYERAPDINKKYGRAWKRIRDRYAAAHPLCEMCLKEGRMTPVDEVHHIVPISRGGTHARDNLMSLCRSWGFVCENGEIKRVIYPGAERTVKKCQQNPITSAVAAVPDRAQDGKRSHSTKRWKRVTPAAEP